MTNVLSGAFSSKIKMRVALVGEPNIGKTKFLTKFYSNSVASRYYPTKGINYCTLHDNNREITLLDFGGTEKDFQLYLNPEHKIDVYFIMIDAKTEDSVDWWVKELSDKSKVVIGLGKEEDFKCKYECFGDDNNWKHLFNLVYGEN